MKKHSDRTEEITRLHEEELSALRKKYEMEIARKEKKYLDDMNKEDEEYLDSVTIEKKGDNIRIVKSSNWQEVVKTMSEMHSRNTEMMSEVKLNKWFNKLDVDELAMIFPGEYDEAMMSADLNVNINTFCKEAKRTWNIMAIGDKIKIYKGFLNS